MDTHPLDRQPSTFRFCCDSVRVCCVHVQPAATEDAAAIWNDEFQDALEMQTSNPKETQTRRKAIDGIAQGFAAKAGPVAESIILEQHGMSALSVGGVAGGMKYSVKGQFFKFAVDQGLYVVADGGTMLVAQSAWQRVWSPHYRACVRSFSSSSQLWR